MDKSEELKNLLNMARKKLELSEFLLDNGKHSEVPTATYYCVFNCVRAMNLLTGFVSSKHKQHHSKFNVEYCKTGKIDSTCFKIVDRLYVARSENDYSGVSVEEEEAIEYVKLASKFLDVTTEYLQNEIKEMKLF